ncbi:DNA polymerase III subunit delta' [Endothiovibrio diazotrophicus]
MIPTPESPILPWQTAQWRQLTERERGGTLPHALLLSGPSGLGKNRFADALAAALLCESRRDGGGACGKCRGCKLMAAGSHPDFRRVAPEEEGKQIRIDPIRELAAYLTMSSQYAGYKVAVITPAERMNVNAANGLLKTLEEPTGGSVLILVAERPVLLPPTVRSRCQVVAFGRPERAEALAWLAARGAGGEAELLLGLADGAPLTALDLAEGGRMETRGRLLEGLERLAAGRLDPLALAAEWAKGDVRSALFWLSGWVMDMIRLKMADGESAVVNRDLTPRLRALGERWETRQLYRRYDQLLQAARLVETPVNRQLMMEDLLIPWEPRP